MGTRSNSAVIVDIENLLIAARNDLRNRGLKVSIEDIAKAICGQIFYSAQELGLLNYLYGAISLPSVSGLKGAEAPSQDSGRYQARKEIWKAAQVFIDSGFEVRIVQSSENAADNVLLKLAKEIARDTHIENVFLCSGDGQEPFPTIVQLLKDWRKTVYVISYDQPPASMRNLFECFMIGQRVRLFFEEGKKLVENIPVTPESAEEAKEVKPKKENFAEIYREVVMVIKSAKPISRPVHHERLLRAVHAIEINFPHTYQSTSSLHRLIAILEREFPQVESEELRKLVFAITDHTDLYFLVDHFGINAHSKNRQLFYQ